MDERDDADILAALRARLDGRLGERESYLALIREAARRRLAAAAPLLETVVRRGIALEALQPREFRDVPEALTALARLADPSAAAVVREAFTAPSPLLSEAGILAALAYLGAVRDRPSMAGVAALLSHASPAVRQAAAEALGRIGRSEAAGLLASLLEDAERPVAETAARALARLGDRRAKPLLERLLAEAPSAELVEALGAIPDPDTGVRLARLAAHPDPRLRAAVADALGELDAARFRTILGRLRDDADPRVRAAASAALGEE